MEETNQNFIPMPAGYSMGKDPMPISRSALTFSILGVALPVLFFIPFLGIFCCIAAIIFSIIGLRSGRKAMAMFRLNRDRWEEGTFGRSITAFIMGIAGIPAAGIFLIYAFVISALVISEF